AGVRAVLSRHAVRVGLAVRARRGREQRLAVAGDEIVQGILRGPVVRHHQTDAALIGAAVAVVNAGPRAEGAVGAAVLGPVAVVALGAAALGVAAAGGAHRLGPAGGAADAQAGAARVEDAALGRGAVGLADT